ncbi:Fur family transcriptional regulator [Breoghania sp.]|uniref:Fur family transcriptional regulator n=1 Tax=Breoghania sp. TaxID=2065378 RepID=UPI002627AB06|nr:Fur family transcriptional regulator [Breoghania sp.]MDJ0931629.1 Fur family transcriptional regulator [Breoghania sp.]
MFEHEDHDHAHCESDALQRAETACADRRVNFTAQRRRVLEALLESHVPTSAYDIIDRLAADGPRPAPITVYRALDFLAEQGFVHRIESRNAYVACCHVHEGGEVVFLLCDKCGAADEVTSIQLAGPIAAIAREAGFEPRRSVLEIRGLCARCREMAGEA